MATITRTDLSRVGAMRAFPKLSAPGVLPLGQSVASIIASLPASPGGFEGFILDDETTTVSVVLAHDRGRAETVVVLFEKSRGAERHAATRLLRGAWRAGLVTLQPTVVAVAGTVQYAAAVGRMVPEFAAPVVGMGGQQFVVLDLNDLGD